MRMFVVDAGIDDRPDNVLAKGTESVARGIRLHRADGLVGEARYFMVQPNSIDWRNSRIARVLALSFPFIAFDQVADLFSSQSTESILLAVFAFCRVDALLTGRNCLCRLRERSDHPGQGVDPLPDDLPGLCAAAGVFEIDVDDDVLRFAQTVLFDFVQQRKGD